MTMVDMDSYRLPADSQPKSVASVWGLVATWHWVCPRHI